MNPFRDDGPIDKRIDAEIAEGTESAVKAALKAIDYALPLVGDLATGSPVKLKYRVEGEVTLQLSPDTEYHE